MSITLVKATCDELCRKFGYDDFDDFVTERQVDSVAAGPAGMITAVDALNEAFHAVSRLSNDREYVVYEVTDHLYCDAFYVIIDETNH